MTWFCAEIMRYRDETLQPSSDNPQQWWKDREEKYPLLSTLVKYHLSPSYVRALRVFSKAGQIVSDRRALIKPKHVD